MTLWLCLRGDDDGDHAHDDDGHGHGDDHVHGYDHPEKPLTYSTYSLGSEKEMQ